MATTEDTTGYLHKIKYTLLSSSDGVDTEVTTKRYNGIIHSVSFDPDAGGTQPTDQWDVTITDADGFDVLCGNGQNLSNAANTYKTLVNGLGAVKSSLLTCNASGMGEGKGAVVVLYVLIDE